MIIIDADSAGLTKQQALRRIRPMASTVSLNRKGLNYVEALKYPYRYLHGRFDTDRRITNKEDSLLLLYITFCEMTKIKMDQKQKRKHKNEQTLDRQIC